MNLDIVLYAPLCLHPNNSSVDATYFLCFSLFAVSVKHKSKVDFPVNATAFEKCCEIKVTNFVINTPSLYWKIEEFTCLAIYPKHFFPTDAPTSNSPHFWPFRSEAVSRSTLNTSDPSFITLLYALSLFRVVTPLPHSSNRSLSLRSSVQVVSSREIERMVAGD